jgi:hypothetical protein
MIRDLEKQGIRLSSKEVQNTHCWLFSAAVKIFGCWSQSVEAAGINYRKHYRNWSTKAWLRTLGDDEVATIIETAERSSDIRQAVRRRTKAAKSRS